MVEVSLNWHMFGIRLLQGHKFCKLGGDGLHRLPVVALIYTTQPTNPWVSAVVQKKVVLAAFLIVIRQTIISIRAPLQQEMLINVD